MIQICQESVTNVEHSVAGNDISIYLNVFFEVYGNNVVAPCCFKDFILAQKMYNAEKALENYWISQVIA